MDNEDKKQEFGQENHRFEPENADIDHQGQFSLAELSPDEKPEGEQYYANDPDLTDPKVVSGLKSIRLYMQIAGICAPFSLIFGGVLLGTIALIFAIIAYRKLKPYTEWQGNFGVQIQRVKKFAIGALVIAIVCLAINIGFLIVYWPDYVQMYSSTFTSSSSSSGSTSGSFSGKSSTWG